MRDDAGHVVVIGAGQAACQLAMGLSEAGHAGGLTLISEEAGLPYSRPPLSKEYLAGDLGPEALHLRPARFFDGAAVRLLHDQATRIDRAAGEVWTAGGERIRYDHLVLATGARTRYTPFAPPTVSGVVGLRSREDADLVRERFALAERVTVMGAGFIGMEFAAFASAHGRRVTVLDVAPRALARSVSVESAAHLVHAQRMAGVDFRLGHGVHRLELHRGTLTAVHTDGGERLPTDLLMCAIGVIPNTELALASGLAVDDGVLVDSFLRTSDPRIFAIGDCVRFPHRQSGRRMRLESVQNAVDQAKCLTNTLLGTATAYDSLAWFWTQQGRWKLQIAGVLPDGPSSEDVVTHSLVDDRGRRAVYLFDRGRLVAVETMNASALHLAARKVLEADQRITLDEVQGDNFDLLTVARQQRLVHADG